MKKQQKTVVSIMGRLVKRTPSRHYWICENGKWQRLGLRRIAEELKISANVIKAAFYVETNKVSTPATEKGFKYWVDKADINVLNVIVIGAALTVLASVTDDAVLIALCAVFNMCLFILAIKYATPNEGKVP